MYLSDNILEVQTSRAMCSRRTELSFMEIIVYI
jgi:hypothetical protein